MTAIGTFTASETGFEGRIRTLTIDCVATLVPLEADGGDSTPDFRLLAGEGDESFEIGAGWKRVGEKAGDFVAVVIDDPSLPRPLRANLFRADDGGHVLTWSRSRRRVSAA